MTTPEAHIHFVWLNPRHDTPRPHGPACTMPLQYLHNAIDIANQTPSAQFTLWLDPHNMDAQSRFWVTSCLSIWQKHDNINIQHLTDIPLYQQKSKLFQSQEPEAKDSQCRNIPGSVYCRSDVARVLVLNHMFGQKSNPRILAYADMDIYGIPTKWMVDTCLTQGVAHGKAESSSHHTLCHGFMAFDTHNPQVQKYWPSFVSETLRHFPVMAFHTLLQNLKHPFIEPNLPCLFPPIGHQLPPLPDTISANLNTRETF